MGVDLGRDRFPARPAGEGEGMYVDARDEQLDDTTTSGEEQTPQQAAVARMLANPRRTRRA